MKRVDLLMRVWVNTLLKRRLKTPIQPQTISLTEVLQNAIKMQAVTMGGRRIIT